MNPPADRPDRPAADLRLDPSDAGLLQGVTEFVEHVGHHIEEIRATDDQQVRIYATADRDPMAVFELLQGYGLTVGEMFDYWGRGLRAVGGGGKAADEWFEMRRKAVSRQALHDARSRAREKLPSDVRNYLELTDASNGRLLEDLTPPDEAANED